MQIKSWHIALSSLIAPLIILLQIMSCIKQFTCNHNGDFFIAEIFMIIIVLLALIPVIFMMISKTKKAGACLSIILGVLEILAIFIYLIIFTDYLFLFYLLYVLFLLLPGIFLIAAGIYYFKVESKE